MTASRRARKLVGWAAAPPRSPNLASIYGLADPRAPQTVRYVGKNTTTLDERLRIHLKQARGKWGRWQDPVYRWMRKLLGSGLTPIIAALEHVPSNELVAHEKNWIARFPDRQLLNVRKPGWHPSAATRHKMSLAKLGHKASAETRSRMSQAGATAWKDSAIRAKRIAGMMGHKYSAATLRRMSLAAKGRVIPPEQRRKISETLTGKKHSLETRRKQSRSCRRAWTNPRLRKEQSRRVHARSTPEFRRKLSRANKLAWKRRKKQPA